MQSPKLKAEKVAPKVERTASGIILPAGTLDRIIDGGKAKAEQAKAPVRQRPTRKEVRALGNKRVPCRVCQTPVKLKNFASHVTRLHPAGKDGELQAHVQRP